MGDAIPWSGDPMLYALEHVRRRVLSVDKQGRVWRLRVRTRYRWKTLEAPRRAENVGHKGYLRISLATPGGRLAMVMAHRLVWSVAYGPIPVDRQVNHRNLHKQDNRPHNLELVTGSGNIRHSYLNGRTKPWSLAKASGRSWRSGQALVTDGEKREIKALRDGGTRYRTIAAQFGISISHAHRICAEDSP